MTDKSRILLNLTGTVIAMMLVALLGGAIYGLVFKQVPDANQNALLVLLGALVTNVTNMVQYYFGSSSSDKAKNDTIATQAATLAATTQTGGTQTP